MSVVQNPDKKSSQIYPIIRNEIINSCLSEEFQVPTEQPMSNISNYLTFLEVFMEVEDYEADEKIVEVVLRMLDEFKEKNPENNLFCDTMSKLWKKPTRAIIIKEQLLNLYPKYFIDLIHNVVEDFLLTSSLGDLLLQYDLSYNELIQLISESNKLFQFFSIEIANRMILENFSNEAINKLLNTILENLKQKLGKDFYNLYSDQQKIYIILSDNFSSNDSNLFNEKLEKLRQENYLDYVIVTSHSGNKFDLSKK